MKKLNLKKHVAIALAVLSTNSSLSVFAGGEKPDSTAIAPSNSNVVPTLFNQHDISQHLEHCGREFVSKLKDQCLKRGIKFRFIEDPKPLLYPEVKKAFEETAMIINTINISTLNNAIEKLEYTLIQELPADIANTIVSAVRELFMLARNTHNSNNIETKNLFYQYFDALKGYTLCACHSVGTANLIKVRDIFKEEYLKTCEECKVAFCEYGRDSQEFQKAFEKCNRILKEYYRFNEGPLRFDKGLLRVCSESSMTLEEGLRASKKPKRIGEASRAWKEYKKTQEEERKIICEEKDKALARLYAGLYKVKGELSRISKERDRALYECRRLLNEELDRYFKEFNRAQDERSRAWEEESDRVWKEYGGSKEKYQIALNKTLKEFNSAWDERDRARREEFSKAWNEKLDEACEIRNRIWEEYDIALDKTLRERKRIYKEFKKTRLIKRAGEEESDRIWEEDDKAWKECKRAGEE